MGLKPYDANGTARMSWPGGHATVTALPLSTPEAPTEGQLAQRAATRAGEALPVVVMVGDMVAVMVGVMVAVMVGVMVAVMVGVMVAVTAAEAATVGRGKPNW